MVNFTGFELEFPRESYDLIGSEKIIPDLSFVFLCEGMSGRPTRTLIEFLSRFPASNII